MHVLITLLIFCLFVFPQNLNKQAYDLAKALLKRTAQAIEPYITNVSEDCNQNMEIILSVTELCCKKNELHEKKWKGLKNNFLQVSLREWLY